MKTVKMIQYSQNKWEIQNQKGFVLQSDITACSEWEARRYVERYISSFQGWDYEVESLEDKKARVINKPTDK